MPFWRSLRLHRCGIIADSTLAKSRIHPASSGMGAKQSGCKFDWRHRLHEILLFPKIQGVGHERQGREGLVSSNSSSLFSLAEGYLWERRLYRVRAVWIQTHSFGWKGLARLSEISEDQKLISDLPRATLAILIWLPKDLLPLAFPLPAKGYRRSPIPRTLLPCRHLKTDALVPHDA